MCPSLALVIACAVAQPSTAVVGLVDANATAPLVRAVIAHLRANGELVLPESQLRARLAGTPEPHLADEESVAQLLSDAQEHEARFDSTGADALRQEVQRAFVQALWPSGRLRWLAAEATFARIASLVAAGAQPLARTAAEEAIRRFAEWRPDPARYPPAAAALIAQARAATKTAPVEVVVASAAPGSLIVEGLPVGELRGELRAKLSPGRYRIWLVGLDGQRSLPHPVEVGAQGASLVIHLDFEQRLRLTPGVTIVCPERCAVDLAALGRLLAVERVIGIYPVGTAGPDGLLVEMTSGEVREWANPLLATPSSPPPGFSAWFLLPFGVGQFAQDRPVFGATYAAIQSGLLAWHLWAWAEHAAAADRSDLVREPDLRRQRNLSAALFYGALAATVIEALVVGWQAGAP